jgi:hypothetical protein
MANKTQDLRNLSPATAFDVIYRENTENYLMLNSYELFAETLGVKYLMNSQQWEYLLSEWEKKQRILSDKTYDIKKLYLNNGTYVEVTTFENEHQRSIKVWENDFVNYEVSKGRNAAEQYLFLGDTTENMKIWDVKIAIEIYDHFEQHWNYLTK